MIMIIVIAVAILKFIIIFTAYTHNSTSNLFFYGVTCVRMVISSFAKYAASIIYQQIVGVPLGQIVGVTFTVCWCAEFRAGKHSLSQVGVTWCDFRGFL
jgi:hypothetical protein